MKIINKEQLQRGGFAGLRETRLVMDPRAFGLRTNKGTMSGIGNFIYLADAEFNPNGETKMHSHREVDVISVMVKGEITHQGSLKSGEGLSTGEIQVQRAGGEGFSHNEINPNNEKNRMIQIWVAPDYAGASAGYKKYQPKSGQVARIYGGNTNQNDTFDSQTIIDVAMLKKGQKYEVNGQFQAYLTTGSGIVDKQVIKDGDLFEGTNLSVIANEPLQLIIVHKNNNDSQI